MNTLLQTEKDSQQTLFQHSLLHDVVPGTHLPYESLKIPLDDKRKAFFPSKIEKSSQNIPMLLNEIQTTPLRHLELNLDASKKPPFFIQTARFENFFFCS
jgi:hypothetical protein